MKLSSPEKSLLVGVVISSLCALPVTALETPATATDAPLRIQLPATKKTASVWLSPGASDVLKLVRGSVKEEVILAFIENSNRSFNLSADEIVHLHKEGVSDQLIATMLAQKRQAPAPSVASTPTQQTVTEAPPQQQTQTTVVTQPSVAYVQSPPVYVAAAPTYVYRQPSYVYYDSYPYSYSYPYYRSYWSYPSVSLNFGFRGFYGGYRGGHYSHYYGGGHHWGGGHSFGGHHGFRRH